jgi:putative CocE/NonD family hydrolase
MRRRSALLLAATLLMSPVIAAPVAAQAAQPAQAAQAAVTTRAVTIPSGNVSLDAQVYLPTSGTVHPLVVMPASWSLPKEEYAAIAQSLAGKGYVAVAYTTRGWYSSTGTITVAGAPDQGDVSAVIDWSLANAPVTPGTKVGTFGVSYGAGIGLLAAATDSRIGAVVALSGWTDLQTSMIPGNTLAAQSIGLLGTSARLTGRPDAVLTDALDAASTGDLDRVIPLAETRSPGRRIAQLNANGAALMVANGWQDGIFPPDQFFDTWDSLTVPKRILFQPGDHAISELGGILGLPNDYVDAGVTWLNRYLLATAGPAFPAVQVHPTVGGAVRTYPSLAALRTGTRRVYLGKPSGPLAVSASLTSTAPATWTSKYTGGRESGAETGTVLLAGAAYAAGAPTKEWLPLIDRSAGLVWQTAPVSTATTFAGLPSLRVSLTASTNRATVISYLYDVDPLGNGTLLSWQPWTSKNLTAGQSVTAAIRLQPILHTLAAGHRIALALDSTESRFYSETTSGDTITLGGTTAAPAYLDLPLG